MRKAQRWVGAEMQHVWGSDERGFLSQAVGNNLATTACCMGEPDLFLSKPHIDVLCSLGGPKNFETTSVEGQRNVNPLWLGCCHVACAELFVPREVWKIHNIMLFFDMAPRTTCFLHIVSIMWFRCEGSGRGRGLWTRKTQGCMGLSDFYSKGSKATLIQILNISYSPWVASILVEVYSSVELICFMGIGLRGCEVESRYVASGCILSLWIRSQWRLNLKIQVGCNYQVQNHFLILHESGLVLANVFAGADEESGYAELGAQTHVLWKTTQTIWVSPGDGGWNDRRRRINWHRERSRPKFRRGSGESFDSHSSISEDLRQLAYFSVYFHLTSFELSHAGGVPVAGAEQTERL